MKKAAVIALFLLAGVLRFVNLGYSDYQGDEIKALYNPKEANSVKFFLDQRKGPAQFLVTASLKELSNGYKDRLLVRLPFALAGFGSVVVFYFLIKGLFNQKIAFYSSIFIATNGFFIAFSRIVQYQSLVIFFGLLAVYLVFKYTTSLQPRYLFVGTICWGVSILSHYDGVFFAPIILGLLSNMLSRITDRPIKVHLLKNVGVSLLIFVVLTGSFYIPFVLNIASSTVDYWAGRISGDVSAKISSSRYLFSVYQPIYVLHLYTLLGVLGFGLIFLITLFKVFARAFKIDALTAAHSRFPLPILISLLVWFLIPFVALEAVIYIPGTHIYSYLIPIFIFMGFVVFHAEVVLRKLSERLSAPLVNTFVQTGAWTLFLFLFLQSYYVFVDHTSEYPWENKKFLVWTLPKPTPIFHLSMFGFPYFRHWDEIGDYIKLDQQTLFYTTNERVSISRYHIDLEKDGEKAGYYVHIKDPQTFTNEITNTRIAAWVDAYKPEVTYQNNGEAVSEIYLIK